MVCFRANFTVTFYIFMFVCIYVLCSISIAQVAASLDESLTTNVVLKKKSVNSKSFEKSTCKCQVLLTQDIK